MSDCLIAITFAVAGLEAFINESAEFVRYNTYFQIAPELETWAALMASMEKGSIDFKLTLASRILVGRSLNKGQPPYRDLALLLAVRNEVMHFKSKDDFIIDSEGERVLLEPNRTVERLIGLGVLRRPERDNQALLGMLATPQVARWAVSTVVHVVQDLMDMVPACPYRQSMERDASQFRLPRKMAQ